MFFENNLYMNENERFNEMLKFLISTKKVRNQQHFVENIWSDSSTVSEIKTGKLKIPKILFVKIEKAFPEISVDWLRTGEGKMLKESPSEPISTSQSPEVLVEIIREKDRQIDRLLTLLEKKDSK